MTPQLVVCHRSSVIDRWSLIVGRWLPVASIVGRWSPVVHEYTITAGLRFFMDIGVSLPLFHGHRCMFTGSDFFVSIGACLRSDLSRTQLHCGSSSTCE